jgi:hypothetical protein
MLPELTQVEEILILRVHIFIQVRLVRGQQYRYQGHIVPYPTSECTSVAGRISHLKLTSEKWPTLGRSRRPTTNC